MQTISGRGNSDGEWNSFASSDKGDYPEYRSYSWIRKPLLFSSMQLWEE